MTDRTIHLVEPLAYEEARRRRVWYLHARCGEQVEWNHGLHQRVTCTDCLEKAREDDASLAALTAEGL